MGFVDNVDGENNDDDGDSYMLGEGEFYVEAIVDRRGARDSSKLRYRIRWVGYVISQVADEATKTYLLFSERLRIRRRHVGLAQLSRNRVVGH